MTHVCFDAAYWVPRIHALARSLEQRGAELVVVELTSLGRSRGFGEGAGSAPWGGSWRTVLGRRDPQTITNRLARKELWSALEGIDPDVVLSTAIAFWTGATAVFWCRSRKRAAIIMDDSRAMDVPRARVVDWVKRRVYRNVDAMLIPAAGHAPSYRGWGIPEDRIFYGVDVVDNNWFADESEVTRRSPDSVRLRYKLPPHYFLGIGRQIPKKNWVAVVRGYAAYRRRSESTPWDLVLVGDGPERAALEAEVRKLAVQGVHFHPACPHEETPRYYGTAEALVLGSYPGETWGLVVNEAMACGLPVLVSHLCGCAETLVREGENGWMFWPLDPEGLAEIMLRLSSLGRAEREAMCARSRAIVAEWSVDRFVEGVLAAIDACGPVSRGFHSLVDRVLLGLWKGRYRPV